MAIELKNLKVGDIITVKDGALDYNTKGKYQSWVYGYKFTIIQVGKSTDKEYIVFGIDGQVTGAIKYTNIKTHESKGGKPKSNTKDEDKPKEDKKDNAIPDKKDESETPKEEVKVVSFPGNPLPTSSDGVVRGEGNVGSLIGYESVQTKDPGTSTYATGTLTSPTQPIWTETMIKTSLKDYPYIRVRPGASYPKNEGAIGANGRYVYDYTMDPTFAKKQLEDIHIRHNIFTDPRSSVYFTDTHYYNRYKIPNPNTVLTSSFAHVFFVRPDLNILIRTAGHSSGGTDGFELTTGANNDSEFYTAWQNNPDMLRQLVIQNGMPHKFMYSLSNAARSFSTTDEALKTDTTGETWTGHKVAYGKTNIEGRTSSTFNITYEDNRNLDVYHINKLWMDYISKVYRGQLRSKGKIYSKKDDFWYNSVASGEGESCSYIEDKILDYATAVYYILTAEDGETIIFWSKYFGVFPTSSPSATFSWAAGNRLHNPSFDIPYIYSFKRDYNPFDLVAFNKLSPWDKDSYKYLLQYDKDTLGTGRTHTGAPFIETVTDNSLRSERYQFKLRFRPRDTKGLDTIS